MRAYLYTRTYANWELVHIYIHIYIKIEKNFFHHTKSSILKILSKSPRTQIRLLETRDTQGLPTVLHNDFGGLNFKGLTSKYLLLMTLPPADDEKMKKNRTSGTPTSKKTSDSAFSSKICHTKVKLANNRQRSARGTEYLFGGCLYSFLAISEEFFASPLSALKKSKNFYHHSETGYRRIFFRRK